MEFKEYLKSNIIIGLSPMDGYTDEAFRLVQTKIAKPDVLFTEFVSAEGLTKGGVKLYDTLLYSSIEHPIIGQLFGKDPESFYKASIVLCHLGFDGIDINMGCPAKTVTQHGSGAALIGNIALVSDIINAAKQGINDWFDQKVTIDDLHLNQKTLAVIKRNQTYSNYCLPVTDYQLPTLSVKTRIGITSSVVDTWIPHLLKHNLDMITLHGRTLKQGYSGNASWEDIQKAVNLAKGTNTLIWGNGDIQNRQQGHDYCQKYGVTGILIGRAALGNPWVFINKEATINEKYNAMIMHATYFEQVFPNRLFDSLRKNFLLYASGHPRAKQLRNSIVKLKSIKELYLLEQAFLNC